MRTSLKRKSTAFKFFATIFILGIIIGVILYLNLDTNTKSSITKNITNLVENLNNTKQNNIIFHLSIIALLVLSSLTILLYPINIFYLFYESLCLGFILASYTKINGLSGLLYGIIYILLNKALFLLILIYLNIISYKIIKKIINALRGKDNISVRELYLNYFSKIIICIIALLILDILIYFFGNKLLSLFKFLL